MVLIFYNLTVVKMSSKIEVNKFIYYGLWTGVVINILGVFYDETFQKRKPRVDLRAIGGLEFIFHIDEKNRETSFLKKDGNLVPVELRKVGNSFYLKVSDGSCYFKKSTNRDDRYETVSQPENVEHCK